MSSEDLKPRELEALKYLAEGKTNKDAAMLLGVSYPTFATILSRAIAKVDAETSTHAVALLARAGKL